MYADRIRYRNCICYRITETLKTTKEKKKPVLSHHWKKKTKIAKRMAQRTTLPTLSLPKEKKHNTKRKMIKNIKNY